MKKPKEIYKSQCCNAPVKTGGLPDFEGDKNPCTLYYVCTKCNKPCNIKGEKKKWYTLEEVWDKEWIKLLDRPAKEIPELKKLFKGYNKKKKDRKLIESIKRGIMDLKKGKYVSVKDLDKFFKEL